MNCRGWNPHIALYVEGDLDRELTRQLESHLAACNECLTFAEELRQSQSDVRQMRSEIVDVVVLNRVRTNVLAQVRRIEERRTWLDRVAIWLWGGFRWRYAVLGSIALVAVAIALWRVSTPALSPSVPTQIATIAAVPDPDPVSVVAQPVALPAAKRHRRPSVPRAVAIGSVAEAIPIEHKDTLVQILTDDPNVVIYWLIDQTGGS